MSATTQQTYSLYSIETSNGAATDATREEVEQVRLGPWQGAMDLEDGTEFATGIGEDGQPVKVYRWAE